MTRRLSRSPTSLFHDYLTEIEEGRQPDVATLLVEAGDASRELSRRIDGYQRLRGLKQTLLEEQVPESLGRFRVKRLIGEGGLSSVYLAHDPDLGRDVALKLLASRHQLSQSKRTWILNEARSLAHLKHEGVVRVYEVGQWERHDCIVMEFVEGVELAEVIEELRLPSDEDDEERAGVRAHAARLSSFRARAILVRDIARALHDCHQHGVIHRDVKPSNILLDAEGRPRLIDFGLAHLESEVESELDITTGFIGTPAYTAPEQVDSEETGKNPRSDQFSLGVVMYELLTLRNPFQRKRRASTLDAVSQAKPPPARRVDPSIPPELELIVHHCLLASPDDRYPSVGHLADDLEAFGQRRSISLHTPGHWLQLRLWIARNSRQVLAFTGVAALLAATAMLLWLTLARDRRDEIFADLESVRVPQLLTAGDFKGAAAVLEGCRTQIAAFEGDFLRRSFLSSPAEPLERTVTDWSMRLSERFAEILADQENRGDDLDLAIDYLMTTWSSVFDADERLWSNRPGGTREGLESPNCAYWRWGVVELPADVPSDEVVFQAHRPPDANRALARLIRLEFLERPGKGLYRVLVPTSEERQHLESEYLISTPGPWRVLTLSPLRADLRRELRDFSGYVFEFFPEVIDGGGDVQQASPIYFEEEAFRAMRRPVSWRDIEPFYEAHPEKFLVPPPDPEIAERPLEAARLAWSEALEYAAWAGGRLPTLLEMRAISEDRELARAEGEIPFEGEWISSPGFSGESSRWLPYEIGDRLNHLAPISWTKEFKRDALLKSERQEDSHLSSRRTQPIAFRLVLSADFLGR